MIQELLGEATAGLIRQERSKFSSSTTTTAAATATATAPTSSSPTTTTTSSENLRCPRCDSTNTKFCYYNNYNLTQPRHFCKTCRRYWTKGGALRNVPIGGGCRKNKSTSCLTSSSSSSSPANYYNNKSNLNNNNNNIAKLKTTISAELGKSSYINNGYSLFDHDLISSNPILFASPQNSHLLSLLRPNPSPNPSPLSNLNSVKDESVLFQSHLSSDPPRPPGPTAVTLNARILGLDPLGGSTFPSVWRSSSSSSNQLQNGGVVGEVQQSSGILDFYQRLRSSSTNNNYYQDNNAPTPPPPPASSSSSTILESAPVVGGGAATELGFWNNHVLSWSDLPSTQGAYPLN